MIRTTSRRLLQQPAVAFRRLKVTSATSSFNRIAEQELAAKTTVDDTPTYDPKHLYPQSFTSSSTQPRSATGRPLPINVAMNDYAPLRYKPDNLADRELACELQVRSFESDDLDFFVDFALRAAFYLKLPVTGSVPLPTRRERWTVIRSPFVHAKSKENFERRTHKRLLKVYDANPEVVEIWLSTLRKHAMPGVGMKAHLYTFEEVSDLTDVGASSKVDAGETVKHFGNSANRDVANAVLDMLSDPVFKPLLDHSKADTSEGAPENAIKKE
ncbi:hypothetical protein DV495_001043 [Geotrichum candidum]|nr:hypothetical protein DV495_001043 [Geotrichum candidum]